MSRGLRALRVLFVSHDAELYGAQRSLLDLIAALDRTRFEPCAVAPEPGPLTERLEALRVPVTIHPLGYWVRPANLARPRGPRALAAAGRRVAALARHVRRAAIDVVYTNTVVSIDGALASRLTGRPHVWHVREHVRGNSQLRPSLPAAMVPRVVRAVSRRVIVNSFALKADMFPGTAPPHVNVVHNGIDPAAFADKSNGSRLRSELGLPASAKLVAAIGSLIPRKGLDLLIRAAARAAPSADGVHYLLIGEGEGDYAATLRALADSLGIGGQVHIVGWRSDIPSVLPEVDVLAAPAVQEAFGRTVVEAMAAGRPVVATRSGGPEEVVVDGETGYLVPVGDVAAMADALARLLRDPPQRARMGEAGRRRLLAHFTLGAHAAKIEAILEGLRDRRRVS